MGSDASDLPAPELPDGVPPEEAERLREVWALAGPHAPGPATPTDEETEAALQALRARRAAPPRGNAPPGEDAPLGGEAPPLPPPWRNGREGGKAPGGTQARRERRPPSARASGSSRRVPLTRLRAAWRAHGRAAAAGVATLLLIVAAGVFWWLRPVTKTAPTGERLTVALPDGSSVELNSGSQIRYRNHFVGAREVTLEGEAFFDVAERSAPFVVKTFNAEARVLGTRFVVRAWPSEPGRRTRVALVSGQVLLVPEGERSRSTSRTRRSACRGAGRTAGQSACGPRRCSSACCKGRG